MTKYICKCGRVVAKSTSADNTGNRDTENCKGCPYLLPWGPTQWDATRHAMVTDVKGYECRMSPSLDYATYYQGGGEDKCVLHIYSLDYDFLDQVTTWAAKQFPDKEISCSFDRSKIRAAEFVGGLYGMSVYPMQNKKGMAAKGALIERFFGPDKHRLDKTPEEEKAIVLAAIEAGKAKAQERKENMDYIISKHEATGRLYAYYKGSFWFWDSHIQRWLLSQFAEDLYQEYCKNVGDFTREDMLAETSAFYLLDDYEVSPNCIETLLQCNPKTAEKTAEKECSTIAAEGEKAAAYKDPTTGWLYRVSPDPINDEGMYRLEYLIHQNGATWKPDTYWNLSLERHDREHLQEALDAQARQRGWEQVDDIPVENPTNAAEDAQQCAPTASDVPPSQSQRVDADARQDGGDDSANPTYSAVATAAAEETAATPEPLDSASMTAAPVAKTNEPMGVASENALAGADGSTAFDYSGLDDQTVADLHLAEREYSSGKKMAEMGLRRMADAVAIAHGAVVANCENGKDGKFSAHEDTFLRWCASVGLKKDSAYRMLQVSKLMDGSSPREQKVLEELSPSLLYAAAKPSAPAKLVQAVKDGDITTHKQYQEALAEIKARDVKIQELLEMSENSDRRADQAEAKAKKAEQERDAARDAARGAQANLSAMVNKISEQRDAAEQRVEDAEQRAAAAERRARAAEAEVKSWEADGQKMQEIVDDQQAVIEKQKIRIGELESGITVEAAAVDQEEIERRANELSEPLVKIINQQNEEIQQLAAGNTVSAQASVLEHYMKTMEASLLRNAQRAELASYDIGALDSLARALREFADSIDGIFEDRSEDND